MRRFVSIMLIVLTLMGSATTVCAVQKKKDNVQIAYREWLNRCDCLGFRVIDINNDGNKELLTTNDGFGTSIFNINIYTYKKGKVVSCLDDKTQEFSTYGFYYNKKTGKLHGSGGDASRIEQWYYTMQKNASLKKVYLTKVENGYNAKKEKFNYKYYFNNKEISKSQYNKKDKQWKKNLTALKFYKVSNSNIKKYI
jgi:hypothetical protein